MNWLRGEPIGIDELRYRWFQSQDVYVALERNPLQLGPHRINTQHHIGKYDYDQLHVRCGGSLMADLDTTIEQDMCTLLERCLKSYMRHPDTDWHTPSYRHEMTGIIFGHLLSERAAKERRPVCPAFSIWDLLALILLILSLIAQSLE